MSTLVWLIGQLGAHVRGQVLSDVLDAQSAASLPDAYGVCMAFGTEFQDLAKQQEQQWAKWAEVAGRTLLLVPPFRLSEVKIPSLWNVFRLETVDATESRGLPKLLSSEVRYGIAGSLQTPTHLGANWKGGVTNTAHYKKHPHSGVFALTALPLWSLTVLDHRKVLVEWLAELHKLAGEPAEVEPPAEAEEFVPIPDHFAIMLHLLEGDYSSNSAALETLDDSPVLTMPRPAAEQRLTELSSAGLIADGRLTDVGRNVLRSSPYAVYAEAMEAKRK